MKVTIRANHSTDTYLSQLKDMVLNIVENRKDTGMILINLQKAFDTLDHKLLETYIGFSDKTVKWVCSFDKMVLSFYIVLLDNVFSEVGTINCGLPQRSILGPLLFCNI